LRSVYSQLDDYQRDAVHFFDRAGHAALLFEQGTGKTWITGGIIERLMSPTFVGLGVVRLSNLESTWVDFLQNKVGIRVCRSLTEFLTTTGPRVLLLNYEALPAIRKKLRKLRWTLIFYDESQGLKNRTSLASRIAAQLSPTAEHRLILSGTPLDKQPLDLWAQLRFLAPQVLGEWKHFEGEYLEPVSIDMTGVRSGSLKWHKLQRALMIRKSRREMRKKKVPQFLEAIKPYALRETKDVLGLSPPTVVPEEVFLWGYQRQLYEEMEHDLVSSTLRLTAPLRITQIGKLQQITGGYVVDDDGITHEVGSAKMRRVVRLVKRYKEPLVIFAKYLAEVDEIHQVCCGMGKRTGVIKGKNKKERHHIIEQFQSGKLDVVVCQIKTGGVGIDLYRARRAIIYSSTHSHIDYDQAISRLHRRGQKQLVYIHKIIAQGTIDQAIDTALQIKGAKTKFILNQLRRQRHGRQERRPFLQVPSRQSRRGPGRPGRDRPRLAA
jgi:hypothetical protein